MAPGNKVNGKVFGGWFDEPELNKRYSAYNYRNLPRKEKKKRGQTPWQ